MTEPEEMLVIKTLKIVDKIGRRKSSPQVEKQETPVRSQVSPSAGVATYGVHVRGVPEVDEAEIFDVVDGRRCLDDTGLIAGAIVFVVMQVIYFFKLKE